MHTACVHAHCLLFEHSTSLNSRHYGMIILIFTVHKRSCGKVMFSRVSTILFTGRGGLGGVLGLCLGGICPGDLCLGALCSGSLCPQRSVFRGGAVSLQGVSVMEIAPYSNERPVRILLECILVTQSHTDSQYVQFFLRLKEFFIY